MNATNREIGRLIRKAREHLNYSIEIVAEELGISEDRLLQYELGDARPPPFQLLALCALLRVQPSWFFPDVWDGEVPEARDVSDDCPATLAETIPSSIRRSEELPGAKSETAPAEARAQGSLVEVLFPDGIRVVVDRDFDEALFRRVVKAIKAG